MSRPDLGMVGCKQLAAALGGVTDSDVEATGELNPCASLRQAKTRRCRSRGARGGLLDLASGVRPAMGSSLASAIPWTVSVRHACVASWSDTHVLGDRSPEQWQQDAFGQVSAWLRALGLRS